ncbi:MAG: hypothetical protein PHQ65_08225 [Bacteroidales bacterium]|nr:hypothetical protein [Bacteroidales bacterium]MDD3665238.1 hypothetical protein [Bacteroidales bacterium]
MKNLSLKLDDKLFEQTKQILSTTGMPRNRYINEALAFYNKLQNRILLEDRLKVESQAVQGASLAVLEEFETLHDDGETI